MIFGDDLTYMAWNVVYFITELMYSAEAPESGVTTASFSSPLLAFSLVDLQVVIASTTD